MKMLEIPMGDNSNYTNKFVCPLGQCREAFEKKVKALARIKHVSYKHQREARATGQALNLALSINEVALEASKVIFFCGGPCTVGAGKVI
jgi:protein transport protein SEC23